MTQKMKHFLSLIVAVFTMSITIIPVSATDITTYASAYLTSYSVGVSAVGDDIHIDYTVTATGIHDEVGVYQISVFQQQTSGSWSLIDVIYGTSTNGMIAYNTAVHAGTCVYEAEPDNSYYFVVKVFAGGDYGSDGKNITSPVVSN